MHKVRFILVLLLFPLMHGSVAHSQWVQTNGPYSPYSGTIISFAVSGTNLFAGGDGGGILLSKNNGTSWTAVNNGLTNTDIWALAVSGTNLFVGTWGGGLFLSTNNGTGWTAIGLTNREVISLAISGTNLFAGTWGSGVWRLPISDIINAAKGAR